MLISHCIITVSLATTISLNTIFIVWSNSSELHIFFFKKLRNWHSTDSFLKLSDFEYSEFLTTFLKVS